MYVKKKAAPTAGYCALCHKETNNGYGLLSKNLSYYTLICPNCLVNSDAPAARQAREEIKDRGGRY